MTATFLLLSALAGNFAVVHARPVRCEVVAPRDAPALSDSARVVQLIADATAIVRARAVAADSALLGNPERKVMAVRFEMIEVIKGTSAIPPELVIAPASLSDTDEFNPHTVPYATVRPSGLRGACFASTYRRNAEYLLFLRNARDGTLTPYWAPLAPINEELRGADDPWLAWVRAHHR